MTGLLQFAAVSLAFIVGFFGTTVAGAAEPELMAALSVSGYGYRVKVFVNGIDVGVDGGKSEGRRLFNKGNAMAAKASAAVRAKNFVLNAGVNEFVIEYAKTDPKGTDALEIKLEAEGYAQPLFKLTNRNKVSDKLSIKVTIANPAPKDFMPQVITEGK